MNKKRYVDHWETVAVTALPAGWRNVFKDEQGLYVTAAPALMLQELRLTRHCEDVPLKDGTLSLKTRDEIHEAPYETRVVFGDADHDCVMPAADVSNYVRTVGPGEHPDGVSSPVRGSVPRPAA